MNNTPINIGYLENASEIGGGNRSMEALLKGLRGTNFIPKFVCPTPGPMVKLVQSLQIPVAIHESFQPSWRHPFQTYTHWQEWSKFLIANQISLVHANSPNVGRSVVLATHTQKIPLLCHVRLPLKEGFCYWLFRRLPKPFGFIFISHAVHQEVGPFFAKACPTARQWVVHNGVDITTFVPEPASNPIPRIGIVGNLQTIKGHEDFLEMAALLTKLGKKALYDVIGGETQEKGRLAVLKSYAVELGIAESVSFYNHVEQVAKLINQLDIVVCASHLEAFGRCLIEGMACGKPIVATRVGGIPEIVDDQKTGILVPPHAPKDLAEAVLMLLDNQTMRARMGEQGRIRVEKLFTEERYVTAILDIYREVLKLDEMYF